MPAIALPTRKPTGADSSSSSDSDDDAVDSDACVERPPVPKPRACAGTPARPPKRGQMAAVKPQSVRVLLALERMSQCMHSVSYLKPSPKKYMLFLKVLK